jgi:hypothetical protein
LFVNDQLLHYLSKYVVGRGVVPALNQDGFFDGLWFSKFCARVTEIGEEVVQLWLDQCYRGYCPKIPGSPDFFWRTSDFNIAGVGPLLTSSSSFSGLS